MSRVSFVLLVPLVLGCAAPPRPDVARDRAVVDSIRREFEAGENAGDLDRMARHLAPDVVVLPPNRPILVGADAFRDGLRGFLSTFKVDVQYKSDEIVVSGDWAFDRGTAVETLTPKSGGTAETGNAKYLWLYQRVNGEWKQARLTWNSSDPLRTPAPPTAPPPPAPR